MTRLSRRRAARDRDWVRRYLAGETLDEIARSEGRTVSGVWYALERAGVPRRRSGPRPGRVNTPRDEVLEARLLELIRSGSTYAEAGAAVGVSRQRAWQVVARARADRP